MQELGHGPLKLIDESYGHLMETRYRSPVIEFQETEVVSFES